MSLLLLFNRNPNASVTITGVSANSQIGTPLAAIQSDYSAQSEAMVGTFTTLDNLQLTSPSTAVSASVALLAAQTFTKSVQIYLGTNVFPVGVEASSSVGFASPPFADLGGRGVQAAAQIGYVHVVGTNVTPEERHPNDAFVIPFTVFDSLKLTSPSTAMSASVDAVTPQTFANNVQIYLGTNAFPVGVEASSSVGFASPPFADLGGRGIQATGQVGYVHVIGSGVSPEERHPTEALVGTFTTLDNLQLTSPSTAVSASVALLAAQTYAQTAQLIDLAVRAFVTGVGVSGSVGTFSVSGDANEVMAGSSGSGAIGNFSLSGNGGAVISGDQTTGQVGSPAISIASTIVLTGIQATGQVGSFVVSGNANESLIGVQATGQVGSPAVSIASTIVLTGIQATGQVGSPAVNGNAVETLSGIQGIGQIGTSIISGDANETVAGAQGTGQVGNATITASATEIASGDAASGQIGTFVATGDGNASSGGNSGTGQTGISTIYGDANSNIIGVQATGQVGVATVDAQNSPILVGQEVTAIVGTPSVAGDANESTSGQEGTGQIGSSGISGEANFPASGVNATAIIGVSSVAGDANTNASGIEGTGQTGDLTIADVIRALISGVQAAAEYGLLAVQATAQAFISGDEASGGAGNFAVVVPEPVTPVSTIVFPPTSGGVSSRGALNEWRKRKLRVLVEDEVYEQEKNIPAASVSINVTNMYVTREKPPKPTLTVRLKR